MFRRLLPALLLVATALVWASPAAAAEYFTDTFDTDPPLADTVTPGSWYPDRYRPHAFESVMFDGDERLRLGISVEDSAAGRPLAEQGTFYNTQGRKYSLGNGPGTYVSGDLYVGADWETSPRRSDIWMSVWDSTSTGTDYPILGFVQGTGFRAFTQSGWQVIGYPAGFAYGRWYNLRIEYSDGELRYYIDHELVHSVPQSAGSESVGDMIVQAYNYGETYDVYWDNVSAGPIAPPVKTMERFGGADRYSVSATAAAKAYPGWTGVTDVVLASGEDRAAADVLTAAGLAGALDAPLMLVPYAKVPSSLRRALAAMPSGVRVHVVGGPGSVSAGVLSSIRGIATVASVDRVGGADRYEVGSEVARAMADELGSAMPTTALLANGEQTGAMYDALTASVVAARTHFPVLLVRSTRVPSYTSAALADLGLTRRYIVGGTGSVSESVRLRLGVAPEDRIAGADRYSSAAAVATRARSEGWLTCEKVGFAAKLPDSITGGALMGKQDGPLLYVTSSGVPKGTEDDLTANKDHVTGGFVFGGTASVPESVRSRLLTLIQ